MWEARAHARRHTAAHAHPRPTLQLAAHAARGVNLVRVVVAYDFDPAGTQPARGAFNEYALRRVDRVLAEAAANGVRVVAVLSNYWPFIGGWQAWVDADAAARGLPAGRASIGLVGMVSGWWGRPGRAGRSVHGFALATVALSPADRRLAHSSLPPNATQPLELFMTDPSIRDAFRLWLRTIVGRTNTITGQKYVDDPTIAAWQLANEPHTTDGYETAAGLKPGSLLCTWARETAAYIKGLDPNHMVSTGEEGYRSDKDPARPGALHTWVDSGLKGADFVCNVCNTSVDYGTIHVYPGQRVWSRAGGGGAAGGGGQGAGYEREVG